MYKKYLWLPILLLATALQGTSQAAPSHPAAIVIDPGHGGVDGGTQDQDGTVLEKDLNLQIAKRLAEKLRKQGLKAELTRDTDQDVTGYAPAEIGSRHKRDLIGRVEAAKQKNGIIFISLHGNHGTTRNRGALVFYKKNSLVSYQLAQEIQSHLNQITGFTQSPLKGRFYVINRSAMPSVLIEYGYLSNPVELSMLQDAKNQDRIADLISKGVWRYLALH